MSGSATSRSRPRPFDPRDPAFLADPYAVYDAYRASEAVHWSAAAAGGSHGRWFVFSHRHAMTVLTDKRFRRQAAATPGACPANRSAFTTMISDWMLFQDPPRHTRLRASINGAFTLAAARALRPHVEHRVHALLASLAGHERFDLLSEIAFPLPLDIIADVLGIDVSERAAFRVWSAALRDAIDMRQGTNPLARAEVATVELRAYFDAAWRRHFTTPNDGVLGALFALEGPDTEWSIDEAFGTFSFLLSAGHETTTNLIGSGMHLLGRYPGERERLREEPALMARAVEEILRFESPVQLTSRVVSEPLELGDQQLLPGQRVDVLIGAANRDPDVFDDPSRFDVGRWPNPHMAFGLGSHRCVGASLARIVGAAALPVLLDRVHPCDVDPAVNQWTASVAFRGLTQLPCRFA